VKTQKFLADFLQKVSEAIENKDPTLRWLDWEI